MTRKVYYIDVGKMSTKEATNLIDTLRVMFRYKVKCPRLLEAVSERVIDGQIVVQRPEHHAEV